MRVLQIVKTNEGASWALAQARSLHEGGVDVVTVLPSLDGGMASEYEGLGMRTIKGDFTLPLRVPWLLLRRIEEIRRVVSQVEPDIIHCHFVTNIMMLRLALRRSRIPRLFQVPGPLHLEHWPSRLAEITLATRSDYWAAACKATRELYLRSGVPSGRVLLAYYGGYGGAACDEYVEGDGRLRRQFGIPQNAVLVGMVSYFYKPKRYLLQRRGLKGHEDFIDAIALVRTRHPEVVGVIIGGAWGNADSYVERVKAYADQRCRDSVVFTGFRSDLKMVYRELGVAVHPSHSENLGGAAESLAAGVPTVSTTVGGFPDIVLDGETGLTARPRCPQELAEAIVRMVEDPEMARAMAQAGKRLVHRMLDIESTSSVVLDGYQKILQAQAVGGPHG